MIVVLTEAWSSTKGTLWCFKKNGNIFQALFMKPTDVALGKKGLAWGRGVHHKDSHECKKEGDGKSPAGIFTISRCFGHASLEEIGPLKMDYIHLTRTIEAVDDCASRFYNQIVDRSQISNPDWMSSEKMGEIEIYQIGLTIDHNYPSVVKGVGSAIFMHIWRGLHEGTAGCTALPKEKLMKIIHWLDATKSPLLVQLPYPEYQQLASSEPIWGLPFL